MALSGALANTGGVTNASAAQNYGSVAPEASTSRNFTFTASNSLACGSTIIATVALTDGANNLGNATFRIPNATIPDRARVVGSANLPAAQLALANAFVNRPEFTARYPASQTAAQFVDALLGSIQAASGANLASQRDALISLFGTGGHGAVLYRLADDNAANPINNRPFIDAEYNRAFVLTQYFGYLRRDADLAGFNFWLNIVSGFPLRSPNGQNAMVCAFITSTEYQQRFSIAATRSNSECPPVP